jgi:DNA-binding SARP family transcriptional activator
MGGRISDIGRIDHTHLEGEAHLGTVSSKGRCDKAIDSSPPTIALAVLGGFELRVNQQFVLLPRAARRVLVFVAVRNRPQERTYVAQSIWPGATERHADGNLRSSLWKLRRLDIPLIDVRGGQVALSPVVTVDFIRGRAFIRRVLDNVRSVKESELDEGLLCDDLLPDWYDEWIIAEREHYRQLRLHALDSLCRHFVSLGSYGRAVQAGVAAVSGEPLRESANAALIHAYMAEGNTIEAIRLYDSYRRLLKQELEITPSPAIRQLIYNDVVMVR